MYVYHFYTSVINFASKVIFYFKLYPNLLYLFLTQLLRALYAEYFMPKNGIE